MTTGVKKDGSLSFLEHRCVLDGGAYASFGIATVYYSGSLLGGPYRLKNMKYDGFRAVTNKPACGAQRGHGAVIARALFEVQLDRISEELGMDPIELRLKNVMQTGQISFLSFILYSTYHHCLVSSLITWVLSPERPLSPNLIKNCYRFATRIGCKLLVVILGYSVHASF